MSNRSSRPIPASSSNSISLSNSPFQGSALIKPSTPSIHSNSSSNLNTHPSSGEGNSTGNNDSLSTYQEQISSINNISPGNIDYKTLSKHLVNQEDTLKLQGGDVARYIYHQIESANKNDGVNSGPGKFRDGRRTRSSSFSTFLSESRRESTASDINIPGGFRREFIINKSLKQNTAPPNFLTRNFVEFLSIYGHFAGEDFSDEDDETEEEGGEIDSRYEDVFDEESSLLTNERRLPPIPKFSKKKKKEQVKGSASLMKTFFLVFKSLVGSGVLFLPRAFFNGGLVFSTIALAAFGLLTFFCYIALIKSKKIINKSSFGELGYKTYGTPLKICILISIIISQIGFVSTYILFTAQNLTSFLDNALGIKNINTGNIVLAQCILLIPLVLIRNLTKLSLISVISSAFIIIGLLIIFYFSGLELLTNGLGPNIVSFNSHTWPMLIGVAVTSFEGIGLILPIESSMANPEKFPLVLGTSMALITALFVGVGVIGYTAFGENVKSIIILNLPQGNFSVQSILLLYSLAVFLSAPLQLFPAIKIGESVVFNSWLFRRDDVNARDVSDDDKGKLYHNSGKYSPRIKWYKNIGRSLAVIFICFVAYFNADNIDKFVSFNGCFACIPLVYIYPPLIHLKTYKIKQQTTFNDKLFKFFDYVLIVVGFVAMVYTTVQILFS